MNKNYIERLDLEKIKAKFNNQTIFPDLQFVSVEPFVNANNFFEPCLRFYFKSEENESTISFTASSFFVSSKNMEICRTKILYELFKDTEFFEEYRKDYIEYHSDRNLEKWQEAMFDLEFNKTNIINNIGLTKYNKLIKKTNRIYAQKSEQLKNTFNKYIKQEDFKQKQSESEIIEDINYQEDYENE